MENTKTYLKKNDFSVFLLTVILLIIIALFVYIFVGTQAQREPMKPVATTPEPASAKITAEITRSEGEYRKDLRYIGATWSYEEHSFTINDVELYINNTYVDNISDYSSYRISKDAYDYATGENMLRPILGLSDGKTVEKETKVSVSYVISMKQNVGQVGNTTEITLKYQYDRMYPVDMLSIFIADASIIGGGIKHIGTQIKTRDDSVYAETTYQINQSGAVVTHQQFDVR